MSNIDEAEIRESQGEREKTSIFENIKNIRGLKFLIFGLICGVVLLVIGSFNASDRGKNEADKETITEKNISEYMKEYLDASEQELRALIEHIDGVSNVRVMLTLDCLNEYVYAQNSSGSGESRTYATISSSGNNESMVLVKEVTPKIRGVGIVCGGGSDPSVQAEIIDLCCSVFDISSNCVSVAEGK